MIDLPKFKHLHTAHGIKTVLLNGWSIHLPEPILTEIERRCEREPKLRGLLLEKIAISKVSADNENYMIPITIKEAEEAL